MTMQGEGQTGTSWQVLRVQTGKVESHIDSKGKRFRTGIYKHAVEGPVQVGPTGLTGDERTGMDPNRAICFQPLGHYHYWEAYFNRPFPLGIFGENVTLDGGLDHEVCIGDIYQCGSVVMQVTETRMPCVKQAKKLDIPNFVKLIEQHNRRGWLVRILEPGSFQTGDAFTRLERPHPDANVVYFTRTFFERKPEQLDWLLNIREMATDWYEAIERYAASQAAERV